MLISDGMKLGHEILYLSSADVAAWTSVPTGPIAGNRARALCPSGFEVLVEGLRRPSDGHTEEELVWRVRCTQG